MTGRAPRPLCLGAALFVLLSLTPLLPVHAAEPPHVPGEVIIQFRSAATQTEIDAILSDLGASRVRPLERIRARHSRITRLDVTQAIARYRNHPQVEFIEPNYIYATDTLPNDVLFEALWGLNNTGQTGGASGADISATQAWDVFTGSHDILVAILDTGVDYYHPDLAANIWTNPGEIPGNGFDDDGNGIPDDIHGWDFLNNDDDPIDDNGHGTHVAGTIGAVGNNLIGVTGVSWDVSLMPLKFLGASGTGSTADAILCIDYAIGAGVDVMNNSWGGSGYSEALRQAIERAGEAGILFVAAAGNASRNADIAPHYPASYDLPNVISVAATDHNDQLAEFSNYGPHSVDLAAPGAAVLSASRNESYRYLDGTSMATPHVAGALALILGRFPGIGAVEAKALLLDRVDPLHSLDGLVRSGGRLNAFLPIAESDEIPPAAVSDLATGDPNATRIDLTWTASGDDGLEGSARRYDVRYSEAPIDELNFDLAWPAHGAPAPALAGSSERMRVAGLEFSTTYYFALRVLDELGNTSPISNLAVGTTLGAPDVEVSTDGLHAELLTGGTAVRSLTLHNHGAGEATFSILVESQLNFNEVQTQPAEPWQVTDLPVASEPYGTTVTQVADSDTAPVARDAAPNGLRILIVASGTGANRIRLRLEDLPDVAWVGMFNAAQATPTLDELLAYDAALLVINSPLDDPVAMGNVLADYVDRGSGLVMTLASLVWGWAPAGRLLAERYFPFELGWRTFDFADMGSYDASHPIMEGVTQAWGDLLASVELAPGADLVASWSYPTGADFHPFVATKGHNVVGVNIFLGEDQRWAGDVPILLRNAVRWSARRTRWLSAQVTQGVIPAGASLDVAMRFDATDLSSGAYEADVLVSSNDPDQPQTTTPASLDVTSAPDIRLSAAELDFGQVYVGATGEDYVLVYNDGFEPLAVTGVATDSPAISLDTSPFTLLPGERRLLIVTFAPAGAGQRQGRLSFESNDPDSPTVELSVVGAGLIPPEIDVVPDAFDVSLFTGETAQRTMTIHNDGGSDLNFDLLVRREMAAPVSVAVSTGYTFFDDFEDGDSDGWRETEGNGSKEVTDATAAANTSYSYHEYNAPHPLDHFDGVYHLLDEVQPSYIAFWVRSGSAVAHDGYFVVRDSAGRIVVAFYARATGYFAVNPATGGHWAHPYRAGSWYHVEFRDVDWLERSFDYWVDDILVAENLPFSSQNSHSVHRIDLYNFSVGSEAWWDQIHVATVEPGRWVTSSHHSGTVPAGGSTEIDLGFDATGLNGGDYHAEITIFNNDLDESELIVPINLHVTGAPDIGVAPAALDYGTRFTGVHHELPLRVFNEGTDRLHVSAVQATPGEFSVDPSGFELAVGESRDLVVGFDPLDPVPVAGALTLFSDDPDEPAVDVLLQGVGLLPPVIAIAPASLDETLLSGETTGGVLTISNTGGSDLELRLGLERAVPVASGATTSATTLDTAVWATGFERLTAHSELQVEAPPTSRQVDLEQARVLVVQDTAPWGSAAHLQILNDLGVGYDFIHSAELESIDLFGYAMVLVPSDQPTRFYRNLAELENKLGAYVHSGGVLEYHAAGWGRWNGNASVAELPGGVQVHFHRSTVNHLLEPDHPLVSDVPDPFSGDPVSMAWFSELPTTAVQIATDDEERTNLITYPFGAGLVFSGCQSFEPSFDEELPAGTILANMLSLAATQPPVWLAVEPAPAVLGPGESVDLALAFDATSLFANEYHARIVVQSNDPHASTVIVPVRLGVSGEPEITISTESLEFGPVLVGAVAEQSLTVTNWGTAVLHVTAASTDHADFSATATSFELEPWQSRQLTVTFAPSVAQTLSATLTLGSDDPDAATRTVALRGEGLVPPDIAVTPDAIELTLVQGQSSSQGITVANSGPHPLEFSVEVVPAPHASASSWLRVSPRSGVVPPLETAPLFATVDSSALGVGSHAASILVHSNDPDEPTLTLPVALEVLGRPELAAAQQGLDYGTVYIGFPAEQTLTLSNAGSAPVEVYAIRSDHPDFIPAETSMSLAVGESRALTIRFDPDGTGPAEGSLTIESNDFDGQPLIIAMSGSGLVAPELAVSTAALVEQLVVGHSSTRVVRLDNVGGSDLVWRAEPHGEGAGGSLERLLATLDQSHAEVIRLIPQRFDFIGGVQGTNIVDGGRDMFDRGNYLQTDLGGFIPYSDGVVVDSDLFGPGGRYFTRKYPGLFVLVADLSGVDEFVISGGLGADGSGSVDGTVLQVEAHGTTFHGFVKRVHDANDPSVNHLVLVAGGPGVQHEFLPDTDEDYHRVFGLSGRVRLYYLLYSSWWGIHIDDAATQAIMNAFVEALPSAPTWLAVEPAAGVQPSDEGQDLTLTFNPLLDREPGLHEARIEVASNDPRRPLLSMPVTLDVREPPRAQVEPAGLVATLPPHGLRIKKRTLALSNTGGSDLSFSLELPPYVSALPGSGIVPPGQQVTIALTLSSAALEEGDYDAPLLIHSDDPLNGSLAVPLAFHVGEIELDRFEIDWTPRDQVPGTVVEAWIQLPAPYDPSEVVVGSVSVWGAVSALAEGSTIGDRNLDGVPDLTLQFDATAFERHMPPGGAVTAVVGGEVEDRIWFTGSVTLRPGYAEPDPLFED